MQRQVAATFGLPLFAFGPQFVCLIQMPTPAKASSISQFLLASCQWKTASSHEIVCFAEQMWGQGYLKEVVGYERLPQMRCYKREGGIISKTINGRGICLAYLSGNKLSRKSIKFFFCFHSSSSSDSLDSLKLRINRKLRVG